MAKNQLFKKIPSDKLLEKILNAFGLEDLNDKHSFTRKHIKMQKTVYKIMLFKYELESCYLPCKSRTYLNDLNEKNIITVLRQILRTRNYTISSSEKYIQGSKFISYKLDTYDKKQYNPIIKKIDPRLPIVVSFT